MKRLLWKEWQERKLWLLLWVLAVVITAALGIGQRGFGPGSAQSPWLLLSVLSALLAGLGAYGSELVGERATFLYSRALLWKRLFFAKVLLGLVTALLAATLGAIAFRIAAPEVYHPFMTPGALALGALEMAGYTSAAYLLGLGCSIVLPGLAGGILALLLWAGILLGITFVADRIGYYNAVFCVIFFFLSPIVAGVVLARFGVTVRSTVRVFRFSLIVVLMTTFGLLLDIFPPLERLMEAWATSAEYTTVMVSPSGSSAYAENGDVDNPAHYWLQLSNGGRYTLLPNETDTYLSPRWIADNFLLVDGYTKENAKGNSTFIWWDNDRLRSSDLSLDIGYAKPQSQAIISPDGKRILFTSSDNLQLFSLRTGKVKVIARLEATLTKSKDKQERKKATASALNPSQPFAQSWWQSDQMVGYIDPATGKRVLVDVE